MSEIFANKPPNDSPFYKFMATLGEEIDMNTWDGYRGM